MKTQNTTLGFRLALTATLPTLTVENAYRDGNIKLSDILAESINLRALDGGDSYAPQDWNESHSSNIDLEVITEKDYTVKLTEECTDSETIKKVIQKINPDLNSEKHNALTSLLSKLSSDDLNLFLEQE